MSYVPLMGQVTSHDISLNPPRGALEEEGGVSVPFHR